MKYLRLHNVSIHIIFYENRFKNECASKKTSKNLKSKSFTISQFFCEIYVEELTLLNKQRCHL